MAQQIEKQLSKHKGQVTNLENRIEESKRKLEKIDELGARITELESENEVHVKERQALVTERDEMNRYASELVEKVKNEVEGKEFMIDRRMINTFLVQYMNPNSDESTRQHMLDAMSKVLGFTMEEKQILGLVERQKIEDQPTQASAGAAAAPKDIKGMG